MPVRGAPTRGAVDEPAVSTVAVPFAAGETLEAPLTWSQRYYLAEVDAARPYGRGLTIPRLYRLRSGLRQADVTRALGELLERYESLRSRVERDGDTVRQRVHGRGLLSVALHDLGPAAAGPDAGAAAAGAVLDGLAARPFDVTGEWPVRAALITAEGRPRFLALVFSHVVVDAYALLPVSAHLVGTCAEEDPVARTPLVSNRPGHQPREQAAAEASPAGRRAAERALRHAEAVFRVMPAATAAPRRAVTGERFRFLRRRSAALDLAVGTVAARTGESPAAVLTAAMASVEATRTEGRYGCLQLISANRLRPETIHAVVPLSQPTLCCVDTAGASFTELVRRAAAASLRAFRAGCYPPDTLAELRAAVEAERGVRLDTVPTLNYRPRATGLPVREADADELARADGAESAWLDSDLLWQGGHYLSADVDESGIRLTLQVDTAVHPPDRAERWLTDLELLVRTAALDGARDAEPFRRG